MNPKTNSHVITIVVATVCSLAFMCVATLCACVFWKIPSMSDTMSAAFAQIASTLIGALLAMLVNTRAQMPRKEDPLETTGTPSNPISAVITNQPNDPVPVETTP